MRHGEAQWPAPRDSERPLTTTGQRQVRESVQWLARQGVEIECLLASPLVRAQQSAEIARHAFDCDIQTINSLQPDTDPRLAEKALQPYSSALICFHQPLISRLVQRWTGQSVAVGTGAVFVLEGEFLAPDWLDLRAQFCPN